MNISCFGDRPVVHGFWESCLPVPVRKDGPCTSGLWSCESIGWSGFPCAHKLGEEDLLWGGDMFGACGSQESDSIVCVSGMDRNLCEGLMSSFCIFVRLTVGWLAGDGGASEGERSLIMCSKLCNSAMMVANASFVLVV